MEKIGNDVSMGENKQHVKEVDLSEGSVSPTAPRTPPEYALEPQFDAKRTKTLLRKLDWHLVPFLSLLYL